VTADRAAAPRAHWYHWVLAALAGAILVNGVPHFVNIDHPAGPLQDTLRTWV
jgi:hypothetical protein